MFQEPYLASSAGATIVPAEVTPSDPPASAATPSTVSVASGAGAPPNRVSLDELWREPDDRGGELTEVRLGPSEIVVIPFARALERTELHYLDFPEFRGYTRCNGDGCILCRAGNQIEIRNLMPAYLPTARRIGVLPISPATYPGALGPKLKAALADGRRVALLISRPDRAKHRVDAVLLTDAMDDGAAAIAAFLRRDEVAPIELASVYQRQTNRDLAAIPGIAALLRFKGVEPDAVA